MPDEDRVGAAVLQLLGREGLGPYRARLLARWVTDGLPAEPVAEEEGILQLESALVVLRELHAEVLSLIELSRRHPDGFLFMQEDDTLEGEYVGAILDDREPPGEGALAWAAVLGAALTQISEFVDGDRG